VERWSQGGINLLINSSQDSFARSHYAAHGSGVYAIAFAVDDITTMMARADTLRATTFRQPVGPGEMTIPAMPCKIERVIEWGISVDTNFLKAHAERCRLLAENADEFTKRRLLALAVHYEKRLKAAEPSAATRFLKTPLNTKDATTQV